jgi:hypothetical protein
MSKSIAYDPILGKSLPANRANDRIEAQKSDESPLPVYTDDGGMEALMKRMIQLVSLIVTRRNEGGKNNRLFSAIIPTRLSREYCNGTIGYWFAARSQHYT